jgi:hypothetical protein
VTDQFNRGGQTKRVPPHIAYALCSIEVSGNGYEDVKLGDPGQWVTIVNKYPHQGRICYPNVDDYYSDGGFGPGQITGLTALQNIQENFYANNWLGLSLDAAREKAIDGLARLAGLEENIRYMLKKLSNAFGKRRAGQSDPATIGHWDTAIQLYNPYDQSDRLGRALGSLTREPSSTIPKTKLNPLPMKAKEWGDLNLVKDSDFDGTIDRPANPPKTAQ